MNGIEHTISEVYMLSRITQISKVTLISFIAFLYFTVNVVFSAPPPLRDQISLNGIWTFTPEGESETTISVPGFWDADSVYSDTSQGIYKLDVSVPSSWNNKIIRVEFEGINHIADIYVNDVLVTSHVGGWIPFSIDITSLVKPGTDFVLKADVKGGNHQPIVDENGNPQWPVSWYGHEQRWGIIFDVWLRAYGKVHIDNTFIQTSYRNKTLQVDYQIKNSDRVTHTVTIQANVKLDNEKNIEKAISGPSVTLLPGEMKKVTVTSYWAHPHLWSPDNPKLYILNSKLVENDAEVDEEFRRFGFREIWISGNRLMFNGHRLNLSGTSITHSDGSFHEDRYQHWYTILDRLKNVNIRTVRFHNRPVAHYILDIADERGIMVIEESAIYAREYMLKSNKAEFLKNCKEWIEPWVQDRRNHPCIVIWSAENEMGKGWLKWMSDEEVRSLGETVRFYDSSRPVIHHGDWDIDDEFVIYHYPEGYENTVSRTIYAWVRMTLPDRPTGIGEFLTHYGPNGEVNKWWQGTWIRGLRYVNFSYILPFTLNWSWQGDPTDPKSINQKNSFAPVALFDKKYDDLGIDPVMNENFPPLDEGTQETRTLILYNDECEGTDITIEIKVKSGNTIYATGSKSFNVPFGEHIDIPYSFQVPNKGGSTIDVILITRKNGVKKFEESKRFNVVKKGLSGTNSSIVSIEEGSEPAFK